jgi:hypothetical protein
MRFHLFAVFDSFQTVFVPLSQSSQVEIGETIYVVDTVNHNQSCWLAISQLSWIIYELNISQHPCCLHPNYCNRWLYTQFISILFCQLAQLLFEPKRSSAPPKSSARALRPSGTAFPAYCRSTAQRSNPLDLKKNDQTYGELKSCKIQNYQPCRCAYYLLTMARAWNLTEPPFKCFTPNLVTKSSRQNNFSST